MGIRSLLTGSLLINGLVAINFGIVGNSEVELLQAGR